MSSQKNIVKTKEKMPEKGKMLIKNTLRHVVRVLRIVDKGLDLGVKVFDYVVKVSKVVALFLGATTSVYVAQEIPNRTETESMGDVVARGVDNRGRDLRGGMNRIYPCKNKGKPKSSTDKVEKEKISYQRNPVLNKVLLQQQNIRDS